ANPALSQGPLALDLAEDTGLLTLTPSSDTCYATIDVVIGNMRFESSQGDGLVLREKRAFLVEDEASPFFVRTAVFTKSGIAIDHAFLVLDLRCPLGLSPNATAD